jgi:hypothetical protein
VNANVKPIANAQQQLDTECTLASLRTVSARLKLIDLRVAEIGLALKRGTITPSRAIALCEEAAPGCLDIISNEISK